MTRWHEDDLAGRLLAKEGDEWEVINLPCIAESEDDLLQRKIGEPLWADFGFDEAWAERMISKFADQPVAVLSKEHLIKNKLASARTRDLADVEALKRKDRNQTNS